MKEVFSKFPEFREIRVYGAFQRIGGSPAYSVMVTIDLGGMTVSSEISIGRNDRLLLPASEVT